MEFPIQRNLSSVTWLYIVDESTTNNAPPSWFEIVGASPSIRVTHSLHQLGANQIFRPHFRPRTAAYGLDSSDTSDENGRLLPDLTDA